MWRGCIITIAQPTIGRVGPEGEEPADQAVNDTISEKGDV